MPEPTGARSERAPTRGPDTRDDMSQVLAQLAASRAELRSALLPEQHGAGPGTAGAQNKSSSRRWARLKRRLRSYPAAVIALEALDTWWHHHPLRASLQVADQVAQASLVPLVRRHPVAVLAIAALLGAGITTSGWWRRRMLVKGLGPLPQRARHWVWSQLSDLPLQALVTAALLMLRAGTPPDAASRADRPANADPEAQREPAQP